MELDFNNDRNIDPNRLDVEWLEHPGKFYEYARLVADAEADMDAAKANVSVVRAEVSGVVRSDPEKYGITRLTEDRIKAFLDTEESVKEAEAEYRQSCHDYSIAKAAMSAMHEKSKALENLVRMQLQGMSLSRAGIPENLQRSAKDDAAARVRAAAVSKTAVTSRRTK